MIVDALPTVKRLLRTHPELSTVCESWGDEHGFTCLHSATCMGRTRIVKYMLNQHHMDPHDGTEVSRIDK